jgi:hypothetical protein
MHQTLILPDIRQAGYPSNPKAGYRISRKGRISGRILGLIPGNYIFGKTSNKFLKKQFYLINYRLRLLQILGSNKA